ncbi:glycerol kinase [Iamia sp. SCSIO 61187]|uniref:FGGY family carbohydrate kinase n=1 Tax=Iamia sp. SCSIO 61187 TaxID=2722752 RepID=UPI001C63ACFA|nr:FGGY-family carbohydrate kinase [Iamia sp. SCSIO 61187]QYG93745.1 glycerol kinase [Iamia sp. SCSIO 61187]
MTATGRLLVIDVGTSSLRAAVVDRTSAVGHVHARPLLPDSPAPGLVEFDGPAMAAAVLEVARAALAQGGPVDAVGIANQRASTLVWDRATGEPVAPGLGWQDLRTIGTCLGLAGEGIRIAPNLSATKVHDILGRVDPDRDRDLCVGTVDTWIAWTLSEGALHVTDPTNAALTGLTTFDASDWNDEVLDRLRIPRSLLPTVVDSTGVVGAATALDGAPPIAGIAGDQQASLVGQGCFAPGQAKATFGTGGMLDVCVEQRPDFPARGPAGGFPIVTWGRGGEVHWGVEAAMLSAGTNVEWLRDDLGLIADAAESHAVAQRCDDTEGVWYVPALLGLGAPKWDYGARGTLLGISRGSGRPQIVRAVLEGVAHRGADLLEAAEADGACAIATLRIDGGMSDNPTFVQALADATQRPIEVSPEREATTLGAAHLAGLAVGIWSDTDELAALWSPRAAVEPGAPLDRERWAEAIRRAERWHPDLSSLDF